MTTNQIQGVHALLRLAGAAVALHIRRVPQRDLVATTLVLGGLAWAFADAIDGSRGATELLRGASIALRELA